MNHPDLEKAAFGLWLCKDGLLDFLDTHSGGGLTEGATGDEPPCGCVVCHVVRTAQRIAGDALNVLESSLQRHWVELRRFEGRRLPSVYELTQALDRIDQADDADREEDAGEDEGEL